MGKWMILGDEEVDDVWLMVLVSVLACVWFNYSASIDGELGFQQHFEKKLLASLFVSTVLSCLLPFNFLPCLLVTVSSTMLVSISSTFHACLLVLVALMHFACLQLGLV